jgi:hypothetical protein
MENWKSIKGFNGYEVSDLGNVRSFWSIKSNGNTFFRIIGNKAKLLKQHKNASGYNVVELLQVSKLISRLVAENFLENKHNKSEVNHKDGNKLNNKLENLEWTTHNENIGHAWKNKLMFTKLNEYQVRVIKHMKRYKDKVSQREIGELFDVDQSLISMIWRRKIWVNL